MKLQIISHGKPDPPEFTFDVYFSVRDDVPICHVETPGKWDDEKGPVCRIYLNDEVIYENPEYPGG